MQNKFEAFWTALTDCPYELPGEIKPVLEQALKASGFFDPIETITINTKNTNTKTKKLSGYNLYMREKMAELKQNNVPSGERMTIVSQMWKKLNDEEKQEWKNKASVLVPTNTSQKTKTKANTNVPRKLSGYQFYVKETMATVKNDPNIPSKERMATIGKMWKELNDAEKQNYKTKAQES